MWFMIHALVSDIVEKRRIQRLPMVWFATRRGGAAGVARLNELRVYGVVELTVGDDAGREADWVRSDVG